MRTCPSITREIARSLTTFLAMTFLASVSLVLAASPALATPAQVIIIRHAEKMPDGDHNLSPRGQQRALALVSYFTNNPVLMGNMPLAGIYATRAKPGKSVRTIQTVAPLSQRTGLQIHQTYGGKDLNELIREIMLTPDYDGKSVVISWHHSAIPEIAQRFGWWNAPTDWADDVFDRAWVLRFNGFQVVAASNLPQHLLPGDSAY